MPVQTYDAIVLGAGGVGSAAMSQLARRGLRVLGIDRFAPPHDRGSSHGQSRIIRQAYFEHPGYVPLLVESYRLWAELEQATGQQLLLETGLVEIGPADGEVVPGVLRAAAEHGLDVEKVSPREIEHRWPALRVPESLAGVFERRAGLLHVERCVGAAVKAAQRAGAELLTGVEVLDWSADGDVVVRTTAGEFHAGKLVIAAGAWAGALLRQLDLNLEVRRKVLMWHTCDDQSTRAAAGFPCYLFELPALGETPKASSGADSSGDLGVTRAGGVFYGFPIIDDHGLKAAEHSGGERVDDPLTVDRSLRDTDRAPVEAFLRAHLPAAQTPATEHAVCLYTMSRDEHFVVDRHPEHDRVVFAAGLSGHGFKFTPVLGKVLADLAIDGATNLPIEFLSVRRFGGR